MDQVHRSEGRRLFGVDPDGYDRARPDYPAWIFDRLTSARALFPGAITLEIGAGSGLATRHLLARGASPITLLEPDERLAAHLGTALNEADTPPEVDIQTLSFEDASLPDGHYDLIVSATAFHWIEPEAGFEKARRLLKPGGTLALFWNVFQDLDKPDPFHDATRSLLSPLASSPSGAPDTVPFALDRERRQAEAAAAGLMLHEYRESRWAYELRAADIAHLYGNFSSIQRLLGEEKRALLEALVEIARTRFDGRVTRNMTSCLYQFRRP